MTYCTPKLSCCRAVQIAPKQISCQKNDRLDLSPPQGISTLLRFLKLLRVYFVTSWITIIHFEIVSMSFAWLLSVCLSKHDWCIHTFSNRAVCFCSFVDAFGIAKGKARRCFWSFSFIISFSALSRKLYAAQVASCLGFLLFFSNFLVPRITQWV